jgi:hypothetical protein
VGLTASVFAGIRGCVGLGELEGLNGVRACVAVRVGGKGVEVGVSVGVGGMGVLVGEGPSPYSHAHNKLASKKRLRMQGKDVFILFIV